MNSNKRNDQQMLENIIAMNTKRLISIGILSFLLLISCMHKSEKFKNTNQTNQGSNVHFSLNEHLISPDKGTLFELVGESQLDTNQYYLLELCDEKKLCVQEKIVSTQFFISPKQEGKYQIKINLCHDLTCNLVYGPASINILHAEDNLEFYHNLNDYLQYKHQVEKSINDIVNQYQSMCSVDLTNQIVTNEKFETYSPEELKFLLRVLPMTIADESMQTDYFYTKEFLKPEIILQMLSIASDLNKRGIEAPILIPTTDQDSKEFRLTENNEVSDAIRRPTVTYYPQTHYTPALDYVAKSLQDYRLADHIDTLASAKLDSKESIDDLIKRFPVFETIFPDPSTRHIGVAHYCYGVNIFRETVVSQLQIFNSLEEQISHLAPGKKLTIFIEGEYYQVGSRSASGRPYILAQKIREKSKLSLSEQLEFIKMGAADAINAQYTFKTRLRGIEDQTRHKLAERYIKTSGERWSLDSHLAYEGPRSCGCR